MSIKELLIAGIGLALLGCAFIGEKETWYTSTYVNTPKQRGIYPVKISDWWGGNYYNRLKLTPWGFYYPFWQRPMLTSVRSPKNYLIGGWVYAGIGHSTDATKPTTYVNVYQYRLDPVREIYRYIVQNKFGQMIPMQNPNRTKIEDGDRFRLWGNPGEEYVFLEADRYVYVFR